MRYRRPQNYKEKLDNYKQEGIIIDKPEKPIVHLEDTYLEIGMGRGNFIAEHAKRFPHKNYIGIEKQAPLLISASQKIDEMQLDNLKLMSFDAKIIEEVFAQNTISGIYLNFSDPWAKQRYAKRRLTHTIMLEKYARILKNDAMLIFKTDNRELFDFSIDEIKKSSFRLIHVDDDLYGKNWEREENHPKFIQTEYEKKFRELGKTIYYLECQLNKV